MSSPSTLTTGDFFLCLIALLFPPIAVWIKRGFCSADSLLNILLSIVGYLPGLFHAWYIIIKYPEPLMPAYQIVSQDVEAGNVAYIIVHPATPSQHGSVHSPSHPPNAALPKVQNTLNYGTTSSPAPPSASAGRTSTSSSAPAPPAGSSSTAPPPPQQPDDNGGEGRSGGPPPSYDQAVATDHKIQTHD